MWDNHLTDKVRSMHSTLEEAHHLQAILRIYKVFLRLKVHEIVCRIQGFLCSNKNKLLHLEKILGWHKYHLQMNLNLQISATTPRAQVNTSNQSSKQLVFQHTRTKANRSTDHLSKDSSSLHKGRERLVFRDTNIHQDQGSQQRQMLRPQLEGDQIICFRNSQSKMKFKIL